MTVVRCLWRATFVLWGLTLLVILLHHAVPLRYALPWEDRFWGLPEVEAVEGDMACVGDLACDVETRE